MKTSMLFSFVLLLTSCFCYGQKQYEGVYAGTHVLKLNMKVNPDEAIDSVLKQVDSASVKELFSSLLESKIETRISFIASETASLIDIEVSSKPSFVQMNAAGSRYLYLKNKVYHYNGAGNKFEASDDMSIYSYHFTGRTKTILGYACHEAMISSPGPGDGTAWICKELPASISPGIIIQDSPGAILEFSTTSLKSILTELNTSDASELKAALKSIRE